MTGQTISQQNPQLPHELTPRDDTKKLVSEVLKRADQLIRKGELDRAEVEILKAKELEPRNVYTLALEERIYTLKTEIENLKKPVCNDELTEPRVNETLTSETESISNPNILDSTAAIDNPERTAVTKAPDPVSISGTNTEGTRHNEPQYDRVLDRSIELESYRKSLCDAWNDGSLTADEKQHLNELRILLEITESEHEGIEKNVKRECYKNTILRQLSSNPAALSNTKSLTELKHAFHISDEEHQQIQTQLMSIIQQKQRSKILIIDDDTRLLELLASSLEDNGFDVTALPTSDEAFALLRKFIPDLILCDINLETSTMGGFTFYEKVQELKNVQCVPFIFLTGLTDDALVRTGKELGVDDYLIKPISEKTLVSTLRGKLKRFKQLKKVTETPMPTMAAA